MDKNVVVLGIVSFFTDLASSMVNTILPLFIVYILNEGVDKLGYVLAIATFLSYALRVVFGYFSDKYGIVKPFVVTGYLISAISKPLLYFSHTWKSVAFLRGTERIGKAIRSATKDTLLSAYSHSHSGKTFGFHKMLDVAGEMTGALIVFLILMFIGKSEEIFRLIFAFTIIPGIISVFLVIFFVKDVKKEKISKNIDFKKDKEVIKFLFFYFGFLIFAFNDSFFVIKAKESGFTFEMIPLLIIVYNLTQTLLSYFLGVKIEKEGYKKILLISFVFGILSVIAMKMSYIVLGFVFLGIFTVGSLNAIRSYISDNAFNKSTVYGFFYAGVAISASLASLIIGKLWQNYGENFAYVYSITGMIFVLLFYLKDGYVRAYH
ncbi:MAG: MFS transporter [Epsilonproteobacteria bacterium]|nr:MFS transporter [Campylobacterota bacterium]